MATDTREIWDNPRAFRQQVQLAAVQVAALAEGELAAALAYEVEPFSHIPAAEAEVAWREAGGGADVTVRTFEVAVVRRKTARPPVGAASAVWRGWRLWSLAVLAAVGIACDFGRLAWRRAGLERAVAAQRPLDAQIRQLEARARTVRDETRTLREERERWAAAQDRVERLRGAYIGAMDAVASVCGGRTVVKGFASDGPFTVVLRAAAVSAAEASAVMARLTATAAVRGWRLEPGEIVASPQGTTAAFSCRLVFDEAQSEKGGAAE